MITVYRNPDSDTRTASKDVTFEQFQDANTSHINDVRNAMDYISDMVLGAGELHDCTKKTQEKMYYEDFKNTLENGANFEQGNWYKLHVTAERHHLDVHCPDDVNLIDVLEMIVDRVCAGMARSGQVYDINLPDEVLQKAVRNTTQMLKERVEVIDPPKKIIDPNPVILPDLDKVVPPPSYPEYDPWQPKIGDPAYPPYTIGDFPQNTTPVTWTDHTTITTATTGDGDGYMTVHAIAFPGDQSTHAYINQEAIGDQNNEQ